MTGQTKKENIRETLAHFFREENNRLSYQNTIVADLLGEVAGIVIIYSGENASKFRRAYSETIKKEKKE